MRIVKRTFYTWILALSLASWMGLGVRAQSASQVVVGHVSVVIGQATQILSNGQRQAIQRDMAIVEGSRIETALASHVYIAMVDQGFISVRPESRLWIEAYRVNAQHPEQSLFRIKLEKGVARSVTGQAAQASKQQFRLNTPVAAIGIRGTDFTVSTTNSVTQVSIRSGGVVVAPFGPNCSEASVGPCQSAAGALELFADRHTGILEARRGERAAKWIEKPLDHQKPDVNSPARPEENKTLIGEKKAEAPSVNVIQTEQAVLQIDTRANAAVENATVQSGAPSAATGTGEASGRVLQWGRWLDLATQKNAGAYDAISATKEVIAANNAYVLTRTEGPLTMPKGNFNFMLKQYEAFFIDKLGSYAEPAALSQARLNINFDTQSFTTGFNLKSANYAGNFYAQGMLSPDGVMNRNIVYSNMALTGAVGGANANKAAYIFSQELEGKNVVATGATLWAR